MKSCVPKGLVTTAIAALLAASGTSPVISATPEEAMTMETLNEAYNDYLALAGSQR